MAAMATDKKPKEDLPAGWQKIPWASRVKRKTLELFNKDRSKPMFEVGDIIQTRFKGKKTMQVVARLSWRKPPLNEYWYCVINKYGKKVDWYRERDFNKYTIMRKWAPDMRRKFLNPKLLKKIYKVGTRLSIVFDYGTPKAKMYYGFITKKYEKGEWDKYVWFYKIKFPDGDKVKINQYRLLMLLDQTDRYLEDLSYADVAIYNGGDIPIAPPGLRF